MTNILTTCVGECSQANLKQQGYIWSCVLVRPEHVDSIPPKFKARIEGIARRPVK
jgi:WD repeat-containing protein 19